MQGWLSNGRESITAACVRYMVPCVACDMVFRWLSAAGTAQPNPGQLSRRLLWLHSTSDVPHASYHTRLPHGVAPRAGVCKKVCLHGVSRLRGCVL
jgi:hypothetical protein